MDSPSEKAPIRVLVVDGHDASRIGLTLLLRRATGIGACVAAVGDEQALALAAAQRPDVAVVDVSQRGPFVAAIAAGLRAASPGIRLVLSSHCAESAEAAMRAAGADAFLPAGTRAAESVEAVLAVCRREPAVPAPIASAGSAASPHSPAELTEREREVLGWLVDGLTNREIAAEIHLSSHAVKKHASAIFRKLGVRNRTEASRVARDLLLAR
ncbi:MAG TPA: response regulator transcription factor [Solirubrobacterales bacterium]|jgi:DNA-binding NarL/FixJ family response regulator|nr:response regulator transcription factor [Solirubrobacterales bacterium]